MGKKRKKLPDNILKSAKTDRAQYRKVEKYQTEEFNQAKKINK